jgi:molybdate transport system substrate-binding protein
MMTSSMLQTRPLATRHGFASTLRSLRALPLLSTSADMVRPTLCAAIAGASLSLFAPAPMYGAELKVVATAAVSDAFKELIPAFEAASGHKVAVQYHATPVVLKQIEAGEPFDVAIGVASAFKSAKEGLFTGSQTPISSVGLGVGVRAGSVKPDLRSADAFKKALIEAKSVAILPDSVNGKHFLSVFDRLGIGEQMKAKIKAQNAPPQVPKAIASGEAELGLFVSNLLIGAPGVDYAGPVPAEFQQTLVFTAVLSAKAREPESAMALIKHLRSPSAAAIMKAHGMDVP